METLPLSLTQALSGRSADRSRLNLSVRPDDDSYLTQISTVNKQNTVQTICLLFCRRLFICGREAAAARSPPLHALTNTPRRFRPREIKLTNESGRDVTVMSPTHPSRLIGSSDDTRNPRIQRRGRLCCCGNHQSTLIAFMCNGNKNKPVQNSERVCVCGFLTPTNQWPRSASQ